MSSFDKNQRAYYLNELNRSLPSSAMVDHLALERALQVNDTMLPASGTRPGETATLLSGYGMNSAALQKDTACRTLSSPIGMRTPSDRTGCGWWFVPNPSQASTAAHGTKHGAMSPTLDSTNGSGRWIWDPQEAAQAEGLKQAARIQACPDIQYTKYPNIGWCPGTNMALVTDGNGNPAYPQAAGGDCPGGGIVTIAANCPPPPPPPGSGGSGSFSPQTIPGSVTGECSTNPLSNACYQAILPYTGCNPNGALGLALSSGGYPGQFQPFNDVNTVMMQRGFSLDSNVVNNGSTTLQTAFDNFFALGAASASGNRAAQNACLDATIDYCPGPSDTQTANAPFPMSCIRKAGMAIGYPANSPILADNSASYWAQLQYYPSWQNVLDGLAFWMDDARKQGVDGLWDVFGIAVKVPPLPYLAIGTQFSLRPVGSIANVISWGGSQGPVVTRAPDNVAAAIANASAGNMQGGNRLLYSTALATISIWVVSPANNQVPNYVSIQPFNYAGSGGIFLRHSNFQLWAQQNPGGDEQFNSDTSFQIINEGTGQISFQSYNYPDQSLTWTGDGGAQLSLAPTSSASLFIPIAPL